MEKIVRNVHDIDLIEGRVLEQAFGHALRDDQQVVISVVDSGNGNTTTGNEITHSGTEPLPDWCNVYEGLSDQEIAEVEQIILERADSTRHSD